MKKLLFLLTIIPAIAWANLTQVDKQYLPFHNMLQNGGFESGKYGWTPTTGSFSIDSSNFSAGIASGLMTFSATTGNLAQSQTVSAQTLNRQMEASCQIKTTLSNVQLCNLAGGTEGTCTAAPSTGNWSIVTAYFIGPSNGTSVGLDVKVTSSSSGTVNIDECYVGEVRKIPQSTVQFQTAGNYTWTAPAGVGTASICGRGGAGGGSSGSQNFGAAGGGGGASSVCKYYQVIPGTTYNIIVGAGGTGVAAGISASGGNGSPSGFNCSVPGTITSCDMRFNNIGLGGAKGVVSGNGGAGGSCSFSTSGAVGDSALIGGSSGCEGGSGGTGSANYTGSGIVQGGNGGSSIYAIGGPAFSSCVAAGGSGGASEGSGGGGGGAGDGIGGMGGIPSCTVAIPGGNGTNGGGGGGGASSAFSGGNSTAGGNGSDGQVVINY